MGFFRFVVPFILLSIAAVLLTQGYQHWRASKQLLDSSLTTEGTVIRNAPYMSSKAGKSTSLVYFPQVKFTTKDGKTVEFTSKVTSRAEQYKPGDPVRVLYRENKPEEAFIGSFKSLWAVAIIFAASGIIVLMFAAWFYAKATKGWEKEESVE
ncbi:DUF3592 domain-containing protein [Thiolapillus sp.]|uniref:DUF3592 domain-containing protein n=1 Tax=Thiolapillus sp. TaxID=2017437 RepID=UPI0025EBE435|nr:DUF3592 domain-containing protein [Thiolapillus sp.]